MVPPYRCHLVLVDGGERKVRDAVRGGPPGTVATRAPLMKTAYADGAGLFGGGDQLNPWVVQVTCPLANPTGLGVIVLTTTLREGWERCVPDSAMTLYRWAVPGARPWSR